MLRGRGFRATNPPVTGSRGSFVNDPRIFGSHVNRFSIPVVTGSSVLSTVSRLSYRHASEVVRASYFSARFFWGLTLPGRPAPSRAKDLKLTLADHQFSVLMSAIFAYAGLIECFSAYVRRPELIIEVNAVLGQLTTLPAVAEALGE